MSVFGRPSDEDLLFLLVFRVGCLGTRGKRNRLLLPGYLESFGEGFLDPGLLCPQLDQENSSKAGQLSAPPRSPRCFDERFGLIKRLESFRGAATEM